MRSLSLSVILETVNKHSRKGTIHRCKCLQIRSGEYEARIRRRGRREEKEKARASKAKIAVRGRLCRKVVTTRKDCFEELKNWVVGHDGRHSSIK